MAIAVAAAFLTSTIFPFRRFRALMVMKSLLFAR